jgi:hypothetical protein
MKYDIPYKHLGDDLVTNKDTHRHFKKVRENANNYKLELSDDDFKRFFKLSMRDKDINWLMHKMSTYNLSLVDALVSYITY